MRLSKCQRALAKNFAKHFADSRKNFAYVSLEYAISVKIPIEELERRDKDFSHREGNQDRVAGLVVSIVKAVREMIE